jgi:hypothetical protein
MEECPSCSGQAISCGCIQVVMTPEQLDAWKERDSMVDITSEQLDEWTKSDDRVADNGPTTAGDLEEGNEGETPT